MDLFVSTSLGVTTYSRFSISPFGNLINKICVAVKSSKWLMKSYITMTRYSWLKLTHSEVGLETKSQFLPSLYGATDRIS